MAVNSKNSIESFEDSTEEIRKLYKRVLFIASLSQIFGGAGLAAGVTVGGLLAQEMLGTSAFAGLPTALFTLGSAGAALFVGRISQRFGRRPGLASGYMIGGVGGLAVVAAAIFDNVPLLFLALFIYGSGTATNLQTRYAGTDLATKSQRAKSISIIMVFTTFGAFTGPNLVNIMGDLALRIGVPALAGPFLLSGIAFLLAGIIIFLWLHPDPLIVSKALSHSSKSPEMEDSHFQENQGASNKKGVAAGAALMVITQMIMVAIMTMTPVHMAHYGHSLGDIGLVIGIHISAMYLPSLFTGILVDRYGTTVMSVMAGITLIMASMTSAFAPGDSLFFLTLALALLGIGWNIGLISGTTKVVDSSSPTKRAKTQGSVDVFVALSGASGGALSGMVMAESSYAFLSLIGGTLALLLIVLMLWAKKQTDF